jgi:15-cis-phytoene synthase
MSTEQAAEGEQLETSTAAAIVKRRNLERYWSTLFAPAAKRPALLALYAFDAELEHIVAAAREQMVAQIRLQWWRDAIELTAPGMRTGNPVADGLSEAILTLDLPKERLMGLIEARTAALSGPAKMEDLRWALKEGDGTVFELAAWILSERGEAAKEASAHAGLAFGLTQRLRTFAIQASRSRLLLPATHLESRGVEMSWVHGGRLSAALLAALGDFRNEAELELARFREISPGIGRAAWPAFLPLAPVPLYLSAMAAPSFDPLRAIATLNPLREFFAIWRAAWRRAV